MKIHNVRYGFATNSSSSHSLLLTKEQFSDSLENTDYFGWEQFTLASEETKRQYVYAQFRKIFEDEIGAGLAHRLACSVAGLSVEGKYPTGVDHNSRWALPKTFEGKGLDAGFLDELVAYLMRPDLVILGGNDNDDYHPDRNRGFNFTFPFEAGDVCRKDPSGYWTVFNRLHGRKFRFDFAKPAEADFEPRAQRSSLPELVDIKITDQCSAGCRFCYQNSTPKGRHAYLDDIRRWSYILGHEQVFEVALGGGEPTEHPNFPEILETFRNQNVIPNFTTRRLDWLKDEKIRAAVEEHAGHFAYSVQSPEDVEALQSALMNTLNFANKGIVQYVVGIGNAEHMLSILNACKKHYLPITLLGFKSVGRGQNYMPHRFDWVEVIKPFLGWMRIGIDTALATGNKEKLEAAGVDRRSYYTQEGKFSMYIDAVEGKYGPSSYAVDQFKPVPARGYRWDVERMFEDYRSY